MIYVLSEGEYSNYSIVGIYEGPAGLDLHTAVEEFRKLHQDPDDDDRTVSKLHEYLVSRCGLVSVEHKEWWIGAYEYDISEVRES